MRFNELIDSFKVYATNEECKVLEQCKEIKRLDSFAERDRFVIENLIKKSLVSKIMKDGTVLVVANEYSDS
jgi:hypothetical protein